MRWVMILGGLFTFSAALMYGMLHSPAWTEDEDSIKMTPERRRMLVEMERRDRAFQRDTR